MTLQEAIEIVETDHTKPVSFTVTDFDTALRLLIKAGERIQHARDHHTLANTDLLPGETKE